MKNVSQWEGLSHTLWKIKNVWNHQPDHETQKHPKTWTFHEIKRKPKPETFHWNSPWIVAFLGHRVLSKQGHFRHLGSAPATRARPRQLRQPFGKLWKHLARPRRWYKMYRETNKHWRNIEQSIYSISILYIYYIIFIYIYTYRKAWEMVVDDLLLNIFKCAVLLGLENVDVFFTKPLGRETER